MHETERDREAFYRRYVACCNAHEFGRLGEFVADDVRVNGEIQGLHGYVRGLEAVLGAFPNYRWDLQHLLIDGPWLATHFVDTGTHSGAVLGVPPIGRAVSMQEFAFYRVAGDRITEVWATADNLGLLQQLR